MSIQGFIDKMNPMNIIFMPNGDINLVGIGIAVVAGFIFIKYWWPYAQSKRKKTKGTAPVRAKVQYKVR